MLNKFLFMFHIIKNNYWECLFDLDKMILKVLEYFVEKTFPHSFLYRCVWKWLSYKKLSFLALFKCRWSLGGFLANGMWVKMVFTSRLNWLKTCMPFPYCLVLLEAECWCQVDFGSHVHSPASLRWVPTWIFKAEIIHLQNGPQFLFWTFWALEINLYMLIHWKFRVRWNRLCFPS